MRLSLPYNTLHQSALQQAHCQAFSRLFPEEWPISDHVTRRRGCIVQCMRNGGPSVADECVIGYSVTTGPAGVCARVHSYIDSDVVFIDALVGCMVLDWSYTRRGYGPIFKGLP